MCVPFPVSTIDTLAGSFGSLAYVYDKNGNRQSETRNAGVINYTYTPVGSNWLYQSGSTPRPKTANGNTHGKRDATLYRFCMDAFQAACNSSRSTLRKVLIVTGALFSTSAALKASLIRV